MEQQIQHIIDTKTKPLGALGRLETLAKQIALIQQTTQPRLVEPHLVVVAASHGIANEGVSAYPSEVTYQMVLNFLAGGAAINVFTRQHGITLKLVDAGVDYTFDPYPHLIDAKVAPGTRSFLREAAMTPEQCVTCLENGRALVAQVQATGCNVIGFGEMGIGNTSSAAMLMSVLLNLPLADCVGTGTGVADERYTQKLAILEQAKAVHSTVDATDPMAVLQTFGGFEIATMCGAFLEAARRRMVMLVDGFIASVAFLCAYRLDPSIRLFAVFCHQSAEKGHARLLAELDAEPLLQLGMRLGEGTGCAVAYPILQSAVAFLNEMASFESAGVSGENA
ncbi:nicotinate-nucleotide--dimethylbenzimidazole phosphoribosyltransferase [Spirosoma rhododendri]|uniref:Nicotinate-nucleotide--dimethylbenzimidazole phosphoribosyltransferase n=1 Tax=Spirosoma rhododendri TaxID=2728024 RepID=A0A7L5DSS8_9BACT|nr:nicotinate-nucleotide--dimethylbenzimidazole phosphoribosyltransferase [Spirosoma rhododendri]QJD79638.1 nicotinate-nucleotide--dimethylbenzimidazole phosphoribosyltransferase [Spirosoma rhododendri]